MLGELNRDEIEQVLMTQVLGRIGCHAEGRTYVVPVTFAYDGERVIGHSARGQKIRMMEKNPEVCFEVEEVTDLANWRSVISWGEFSILEGAEKVQAMSLLVERVAPAIASATSRPFEHGQGVTPHHGVAPVEPVVFCIKLLEKTGRFERR